MKAVLWTDTLQMIVMVGGVTATLVMGVVNTPGGLSQIWEDNLQSGRLDLIVSVES